MERIKICSTSPPCDLPSRLHLERSDGSLTGPPHMHSYSKRSTANGIARLSTSIEATLLTGSPYRGYRVIDLGLPDRNSIRQNSIKARAGAGSSALLDQARPTSMVGICALTSRDSSLSPSSDQGR